MIERQWRLKAQRPYVKFFFVNFQKRSRTTTSSTKTSNNRQTTRDAFRVMVALVCILFASLASVDHETPAEHLKAQAISQEIAQAQTKRPRLRDNRHLHKLPEAPLLQRINGSL